MDCTDWRAVWRSKTSYEEGRSQTNHGHGVELLERRHGLEQQHDDAATLNGFDGSSQQVGRQGFKILQNAHAKGVTQHGMRLFVVAITDVGRRDEQLKWIIGIGLANAALNVTLDCLGTLLGIAVM